jgi:hypothetical protein
MMMHLMSHRSEENKEFSASIQVELWTPEALIDRLKSLIIQVKEEKQQQPPTRFPYDRKYLNKALELIENWSNIEQANESHVFIFHLSDLLRSDGKLVAELVDLANRAPSMLDDVLHKVLEWLFGLVCASWFYQSAAEDIQVRFDP